VPFPNSPFWLSPQQSMLPPESSAHVAAAPAVTAVALVIPLTATGAKLSSVVPSPNSPLSLVPQQSTPPLESSAHVCALACDDRDRVGDTAHRNRRQTVFGCAVPKRPSYVTAPAVHAAAGEQRACIAGTGSDPGRVGDTAHPYRYRASRGRTIPQSSFFVTAPTINAADREQSACVSAIARGDRRSDTPPVWKV
jgi:hypothetical protein